ncbi:tripartite tricarboxylate transporter substrate-binding protein [soil metagenome]
MTNVRRSLLAAALCASALVPMHARADKPIELVVGFAAGGGTDLTARTLAPYLAKLLNTSIIVSNKPGASGELALAYVARATPDGSVIGMTNMPGLVTIPIERKAQFKNSDFTYLANLVRDPSAFSVVVNSPYKNLGELIADAKAKPGTISYGSTGVGTDDHLAMVLFERLTGTKLNHVPFSGSGPLRNAMLGGHIVIGGINLGEVMPFQTQMRVLAEAGAQRSPLAKDVPTFREQGVDLVFSSERGIIAPHGLPADVEKKLSDALRAAAADPEFQKQMLAQFTEMDYLDGPAWAARLQGQIRQFEELWKSAPWGDAQRAQ